MLGLKILIYLLRDSKSIFDSITKLLNVSQKRLMVNIASLRQSHSSGKMENISHVLIENNISDKITKVAKYEVLENLCKKEKYHTR